MLKKYAAALCLLVVSIAPSIALALADDYGAGSSTGTYCPKLTSTFQRGARDATTAGQVSELQTFLADYYDLPESSAVSGFYGKTTEKYVKQFQQTNQLPAQGIIGTLTRAAIAKKCGATPVTASGVYERSVVVGNTSLDEIEQFRKENASKKCALAGAVSGNSTYYVAGGMIAGSSAGFNVTLRDGAQYIWSDNSKVAYKTNSDPTSVLKGAQKSMNCENWSADMSVFAIPSTIDFKDQSAALEEARLKSRDARRISDIKQLQLALELYFDKNTKYPLGFNEKGTQAPGALGVLVPEQFISNIPTDPQNQSVYTYASQDSGSGYLLSAILESKSHAALTGDIDGNVTVDNGIVGCDDVGGIYCVSSKGAGTSDQTQITLKLEQYYRAKAVFEPALTEMLEKIVRKALASPRDDIPNVRRFAVEWSEKISLISSDMKRISQQQPNSMSISELEYAVTLITKYQAVTRSILAAFNTLSATELQKLDETPVTGTTSNLGTYIGYMSGSVFIVTQDITEGDARANCTLNANSNPSKAVRCTWKDKEIFTKPAATQPTVSLKHVQVVGVYEGTYPTGVTHSFNNHPEGTINLTITDTSSPSPVLVLSSYEPVNWIIDNQAGATFEKVITLGFHAQRVTGLAAGTPIESHSYAKDGGYSWSCAYASYETSGGCSYAQLKSWLASQGYAVANFTGSYTGKSFTLHVGPVAAVTKESQVANAYEALVSALEVFKGISWFR